MPIIGFGGGFGGGSSASYINGTVATPADLPITTETPVVGDVYLCKAASGLYFINRKPAGLYCRTANFGALTDWTFLGTFPEVNSDANWRLYNDTTTSKQLAFDLSGISASTTQTLTVQNNSGTIALTSQVPNQSCNNTATPDFAGVTLQSIDGSQPSFRLRSQETSQTYVYNWLVGADALTNQSNNLYCWDLVNNRPAFFVNGNTGNIVVGGLYAEGSLQAKVQAIGVAGNSTTLLGLDNKTATAIPFKIRGASGQTANLAEFSNSGGALLSSISPAGSINVSNGSVSTNTPTIDASQQWNASGTTFTALKLNVTNTASATASALVDFQIGGTSYFKVTRGGGTGLDTEWVCGATSIDFSVGGHRQFRAYSSTTQSFYIEANGGLNFTPSNNGSASTNIQAEAAATLAQRQGTTAQTYRIYNTYTDASNYERGFLRWSSNVLQIGTEKLGTGTNRTLELHTDGTTRFTITGSGQVVVAAGSRMAFGGSSSSFPALKQSSTALQVRLADDSAFAPFSCGTFSHTGSLGFYGTTAVAQPASVGTAATGFTDNGPTNTVHADSTFTGGIGTVAYNISDIVKHLKTLGLIAS